MSELKDVLTKAQFRKLQAQVREEVANVIHELASTEAYEYAEKWFRKHKAEFHAYVEEEIKAAYKKETKKLHVVIERY